MKYTLLINDQPVFHSDRITPCIDAMMNRVDKSCLARYFWHNRTILNNHANRIAWKKNEDNLITIKKLRGMNAKEFIEQYPNAIPEKKIDWISAMQEYSDQQNKELMVEISKKGLEIVSKTYEIELLHQKCERMYRSLKIIRSTTKITGMEQIHDLADLRINEYEQSLNKG